MKVILDKVFKNNKEKSYLKHVTDYRKKHVPERYNQIKLLDFLTDPELDHYISISNRADGKTFNYFSALLDVSIEFEIGLTFIVRHYTVRSSIQQVLQKIIDIMPMFNHKDFMFMSNDFYISLLYKDRTLAIITDLNQATDLKYRSNFMQDFPIMIYDEFLALEGDYLMDEWERIKTIYSSIDRNEDIELIKSPKVLYLGNAVNFSSPVLANLNLFSVLEKHPMNELKKYDNIALEFNRNDSANNIRNLRAFKEENDNMTKGEFDINHHNIAQGNDRNRINDKPMYVIVKLRSAYLKITYNTETFDCILAIESYAEKYDFNYLIKDNRPESNYLNESFYDPEYIRKYNKDMYLFANMYSKDYILDGINDLQNLKINKIIKHHFSNNNLDNFEKKEIIYKENYIENTKKSLHDRFFNGRF